MSIAQAVADVGDTRALIQHQHLQSADTAALQSAQQQFAALRMLDDVGGRLRDGERHVSGYGGVKAECAREVCGKAASFPHLAAIVDIDQ